MKTKTITIPIQVDIQYHEDKDLADAMTEANKEIDGLSVSFISTRYNYTINLKQ